MKVHCDQGLFEKFPAASIHGVVFDRLENFSEEAARVWKERALESVRESNLTPETILEAPMIKEWRGAFQSFGLKPGKYRSSVEQLYRRALKGEMIQTGLPLVNLYCYVSVLHRAPMGGYDLRKIEGEISIRPAEAGEEFTGIGEQQPIKSEAGVVVYADSAGVICWGWNYRDCARTSLVPDTGKAVFFADSAAQGSRHCAEGAIKSLSEALSSAGCTKLDSFFLDKNTLEVNLSTEGAEPVRSVAVLGADGRGSRFRER